MEGVALRQGQPDPAAVPARLCGEVRVLAGGRRGDGRACVRRAGLRSLVSRGLPSDLRHAAAGHLGLVITGRWPGSMVMVCSAS